MPVDLDLLEELEQEIGIATIEPPPKTSAPTTQIDMQLLEELEAEVGLSVEPTTEDLAKYRKMGVEQYRSPAGKLYDLTPSKMGLLERGAKGLVNAAVVNPLRTIVSEGGIGDTDTMLRVVEAEGLQNLKSGKPRKFSLAELRQTIKEANEIATEFKTKTREAAIKDIPGFKIPSAETTPEKAVDIASGLGGFIAKLYATKKVLGVPRGSLGGDVVAWETLNLAEGGMPGSGAAMRLTLAATGKIPAISKTAKVGRVGVEMGLFGGLSAIRGDDPDVVIMNSLIPLAFQALNTTQGRISDAQMVKSWRQQLPFMRDIPLASSLKMARAMRAVYEIKDPKISNKAKVRLYNQWEKRFGTNVDSFLKQADVAFRATVPQPPKQITGKAKPPTEEAVLQRKGVKQAIKPAAPTPVAPKAEIARPVAKTVDVIGQNVKKYGMKRLQSDFKQWLKSPEGIAEKKSLGLPEGHKFEQVSLWETFNRKLAEKPPTPPAEIEHPAGKELLERNVPISQVKTGDIIAPEARYITSAGYYFQVGKKLEVLRVNPKSITVKTVEGKTVRIPKKAALQKYRGDYIEVEPKFGRLIKEQLPAPSEAKQPWEMKFEETLAGRQTKETKAANYWRNLHKQSVQQAVQQGKPVPRNVLEEYKSEKWAQDALAKMEKPAKEPTGLAGKTPTSLLGGVPQKPPGLTKAESEYLGAREKRALRAGQERGEKIGYKLGQRRAVEDARRTIDTMRLKGLMEEKSRQDAVEIVKRYVPKEKQYYYTKRILSAKTPKRIDNLTEAISQYLDRAEQRQAARDFRSFITETKSKYRRGETQLGKLRSDVRDRLLKVLETYDLPKLSEVKREKLESRSSYIRNVAGSIADSFESLEESGKNILQMPNARIEELNRLRKTHIGELDAEEIRYIQSSLDHLIKIAEKKGQIKERIRAEKIGKLVNQARQEIHQKSKEYGISKEAQGVIGFAGKLFTTAQATPRTLVNRLTSKDNAATVKLVTNKLVSMNKEKHRIAKDFILSFRKMFTDAGISQKDTDMLLDKTTMAYGGKTFKVDIGSLLSVYMDTQAEGNLKRILKTGRVFTVYEYDPKRLFIKSKKTVHTKRPELSELRAIIDFVENKHPQLKKMADVYFKHNSEIQTPIVNKTSMEYQNYELARKERYWHLSRVMPAGVEGRKTDISVAVENQGRYLPRTGGRRPLRVIPFQQEVIANIQSNASFSAMTIPMQDIKALIGDEQWQKKVIESGRGAELKSLVTMLRRIQGQITDKDFIELAGAEVLNNFGKYALGFRLSGYGVQTASIPAAFEVIEPKHFRSIRSIANLPRVPVKAIKEMMDLSPTLWMRWTARQFDFVVGGAAAQNAFDTLVWGDKSVTEKFLNQYVWGDQKAIYQIYLAAQDKVAAETNLKRGSNEFKKRAIEITERALETQPMWDMVYRNELLSSPNIFLRGSLMFQSARNAQYNVLLRAMDDYKKGRIGATEAGKRIGGVMYANILVALVKRLVKMGIKYGWLGLLFLIGDKKQKEKVKVAAKTELAKQPAQLAIDSGLNFISLPAFGTVAQNIAYESVKRIEYPYGTHRLRDIRTGNIFTDLSLDVAGVVSDTAVMTSHSITGEKFKSGKDKGKPKWKRDALRVADGIAELVAMRYGLPYSAPKGEIYYQIESAKKAVEKAMSVQELRKEIRENTYQEPYKRADGRIYPAGHPHKGKEDRVKELRTELKKRLNK